MPINIKISNADAQIVYSPILRTSIENGVQSMNCPSSSKKPHAHGLFQQFQFFDNYEHQKQRFAMQTEISSPDTSERFDPRLVNLLQSDSSTPDLTTPVLDRQPSARQQAAQNNRAEKQLHRIVTQSVNLSLPDLNFNYSKVK